MGVHESYCGSDDAEFLPRRRARRPWAYLAVYLQQNGWSAIDFGLVLTIGGLACMVATKPLGALVDLSAEGGASRSEPATPAAVLAPA